MKKINLFSENGILSGKRVFIITCCGTLLLTAGITSAAASGSIKSQGRIVYDNDTTDPSDDVIFDASDLSMLEAEIQTATDAAAQGKNDIVDKLKDKLPSSSTDDLGDNPSYDDIADAIENIGKDSDFTASDLLIGKKAYNGKETITGTMPDNAAFTSTGLLAGESVTIPRGYHNGTGFVESASLASQTGVTGTYTNTHDTEDTSDDTEDDLVAATADNLSLGTAAWVDGEYIVGNGADNKSYYAKGYTDGYEKTMENVNIRYVYHIHTDASGNSYSDNTTLTQLDNPGGCFKAKGHTHNEQCGKTTTQSACNNSGQYWDGNRCRSCGGIGSGSGACGGTIYKTSYTCGSPVNTWILGCNKNSNSIEKAEIFFK